MRLLRVAAINAVVPGLGLLAAGRAVYAYISLTLAANLAALCCRFNLPDTEEGAIMSLSMIMASQIIISVIPGAKRDNSKPGKFNIFIFFALYATLVLLVLKYPEPTVNYRIYFIPSASMEPTLQIGDLVLVNTKSQNTRVAVGDIVIFTNTPDNNYFMIKRSAEKPKSLKNSGAGKIYVLGDNLPQSTDSRSFGMINREQIVGKAVWVIININNWKRKLISLN